MIVNTHSYVLRESRIYKYGQRHIPYVEGRVGSVDNGVFIHAIVPRHCETVVLMSGIM